MAFKWEERGEHFGKSRKRIEQAAVCREIGARTGGDILIGVVGPVRTGKSTLIKQFMEKLVLPAIGPEDAKLRARDELPQSAAGRTIMTTEPKFIPEAAVPLALEGGGECSIRLIDCVGYMVEGAMGHEENDKPRMVKSPWFDEEIPFDLAAETGTRKVIRDHSTIGIVVTTDGTISEIPRENYIPAESGSSTSWKRWASPSSSCSTAPTPAPPRQERWRRKWKRAMAGPFCL